MRALRLVLLGLAAFLVGLVALFPAAPVVDRLRPELGPVALEGVSGRAFSGAVARARSTDDLLPLEFSNVTWRLAPTALPGGGGARVGFEGYGGRGDGLVRRTWGGDVLVEDFRMDARAEALEPLLPAPIAEFDGRLDVELDELALVDGLLARVDGTFRWTDAVLERPAGVRFGDVAVTVAPAGDVHEGSIAASGGDVDASGTFTLAPNGDYTLDVLATPTASAPPAVLDALGRAARPDAQGRYPIRQSGNVNRLM